MDIPWLIMVGISWTVVPWILSTLFGGLPWEGVYLLLHELITYLQPVIETYTNSLVFSLEAICEFYLFRERWLRIIIEAMRHSALASTLVVSAYFSSLLLLYLIINDVVVVPELRMLRTFWHGRIFFVDEDKRLKCDWNNLMRHVRFKLHYAEADAQRIVNEIQSFLATANTYLELILRAIHFHNIDVLKILLSVVDGKTVLVRQTICGQAELGMYSAAINGTLVASLDSDEEKVLLLKTQSPLSGNTVVHQAAWLNEPGVINEILGSVEEKVRKEVLEIKNYHGETAVHITCAQGNHQALESLLSAVGKTTRFLLLLEEDKNKRTPIQNVVYGRNEHDRAVIMQVILNFLDISHIIKLLHPSLKITDSSDQGSRDVQPVSMKSSYSFNKLKELSLKQKLAALRVHR